MDTFMDKLAQRLTAQEIIKANTAADAEELKELKSQVKEYHEILEQMQKLMADNAEKLANVKVDGNEINRLVEEGIAKINQIQLDTKENEKVQETLSQLEQTVSEKLDTANENVHKECVKVYRNVQAVVVEENSKQAESILTEVKALNALKGKLSAVFWVSIAALIAAVGSIIFQILVRFQLI